MLTPAPGEGYRPLKDEAELMKDSFVELISSLNAAAQHQTVEQVLSLIVQIAEGIEEAEKRDPVFSHNYAEGLIEYFEFNFREGIPKFVKYYTELLDKHEHFITQEAREQQKPPAAAPVKERAKDEPTLEGLKAIIDELESLISVREEALRDQFGPVLKRAKDLLRKRLKNEMEAYDDLVKRHGKVPNDELRKKRLDRAASTHRKLVLAATALASIEPEFREFTFNPIMRSVNAIQERARDAILRKMEVQRPQAKGRKLPAIALVAFVSLLATTGVAYWNGIRFQDVVRFLSEMGVPMPQSTPDPTREPSQTPKGDPARTPPVFPGGDERQQRQVAISAARTWIASELNANQLTLEQCDQAMSQWAAMPPSADRDTNLREWGNHRDLLTLLERINQLLSRLERGEAVEAREIDRLVNPDRLTEERLVQMEQEFRRPEVAGNPESANGLKRVAQARRLIQIGERVRGLLQQ